MRSVRTSILAMCAMLAVCGGDSAGAASVLPTHSPKAAPAAGCVRGTWVAQGSAGMPAVRYESEHFAFRWRENDASVEAAKVAARALELAWSTYMGKVGFQAPYCHASTKLKVNIHIDPGFGLAGGVSDDGLMGMWIGPGGLADRFGLAHEFAHALQGSSGGLRDSPFTGWMWESHANWMAHQMTEFRSNVHCSAMLVNYPHLYYGSTRDRYCNWQFWEYLKNRHGYPAVNDIWLKAPRVGGTDQLTTDPFSVLMKNLGWDVAQLNDFFGDWAMHNVNWDYINPDGTDQGPIYRAAYGGYELRDGDQALRLTALDPVEMSSRRFAVPFAWAPQRWGYNLVRLIPDPGAKTVRVSFRGMVQTRPAVASLPGLANEPASVPVPSSDWRWGLVAVDRHGKARYSALQKGASGDLSFEISKGDLSLWMVVVGTPSQMEKIRWDQPYYSIYRYPWMAEFTDAWPSGFQTDAPAPIAGGRRHANGGGWVAAEAEVDDTAYVGPFARVLSGAVRGNARVEDHATVADGQLLDNAVAAGLSIVTGGTVVRDRARVASVFSGIGALERGIVLSGTAQNVGDVEQRGASFAEGVYYGLIEADAARDPQRGAKLTGPVPEVTAVPDYVWRP